MISKIKKIAVLGGAGLIGSYLVELLVDKGHKVVVIDDFSKGKKGNLSTIKEKIEIRYIDLENKKIYIKPSATVKFFSTLQAELMESVIQKVTIQKFSYTMKKLQTI